MSGGSLVSSFSEPFLSEFVGSSFNTASCMIDLVVVLAAKGNECDDRNVSAASSPLLSGFDPSLG